MDPHFRRISRAEFAALWADRSITRCEIAVIVGLSEKGVSCRAKSYGLALRGYRTKRPHVKNTDLFAAMWTAGVSVAEIAACFAIDRRTVDNTRARLDLPLRGRGRRPKISMSGFMDARLGVLMAASARAEQHQLRMAEMVDHPHFAPHKARAA